MRRGLFCVALAPLLVTCGGQANTTHHAYVVVQHLSGSWFDRRVDFTNDAIAGITLMDRSGIEYGAQSVGSGKVVCQVDNEPATFTACFPQNKPYWALFIRTGGKWTSAPSGVSDVNLHDGEAIGWHYVPSGVTAPSPPPSPR